MQGLTLAVIIMCRETDFNAQAKKNKCLVSGNGR